MQEAQSPSLSPSQSGSRIGCSPEGYDFSGSKLSRNSRGQDPQSNLKGATRDARVAESKETKVTSPHVTATAGAAACQRGLLFHREWVNSSNTSLNRREQFLAADQPPSTKTKSYGPKKRAARTVGHKWAGYQIGMGELIKYITQSQGTVPCCRSTAKYKDEVVRPQKTRCENRGPQMGRLPPEVEILVRRRNKPGRQALAQVWLRDGPGGISLGDGDAGTRGRTELCCGDFTGRYNPRCGKRHEPVVQIRTQSVRGGPVCRSGSGRSGEKPNRRENDLRQCGAGLAGSQKEV